MRRTVPPSAERQASVEKLLARGLVDDPQKMLSELARLGARLIIQRAVEEEFDTWLGRARYAGLGKTSRSTVSRICAELHERFEAHGLNAPV